MALAVWIIVAVVSVVCVVDRSVDGAMWPGKKCTRVNKFILDDQHKSVYYQCSNYHAYRMKCAAGLWPCIGSKCNKAIGRSMYCTWPSECRRPKVPATPPCEAKPCLNGGSCEETGDDSFRCECPVGFSGVTCNEVIEVAKFTCQNGVEVMPSPDVTSSPSNETYVDEECKTWCYVRENSIEQSVTRGCWYPELFDEGGDNSDVPTPSKGCGFFDDKLSSTLPTTDQLMCFCRRSDDECNSDSIDVLLDKLPFLESM